MGSAVAALVATPVRAQIIQVTGVRVNPTAEGVEVILETSDRTTPQVFTSSYGETFVADIINTQLQLPSGDSFRAENPAEGVSAVTVTSLDGNSIRVTIVGSTAVPTTEAIARDGQLIFNITSASESAEVPPTRIPPTPPDREAPTDPDAVPANADIIEIIVTATRTAERLTDIPRSITIVEEEQLEEQTRLTRDLGTILAQQVPGLSVGTQSASNFGQSLRGRNISVLIDGVPQSTNRNAARDLRTIDPSAIERVEVLRGPTAIYGDGATGGVINIITKSGTDEGVRSQTRVEFNAFPSNFSPPARVNLT
jgi:iron complex outermembrane receptor protein